METETGLVDTERGEGGRRPLGGLGDPSAGKNRKSVQGLEGGFGELREEEGLRRTRRRGWGVEDQGPVSAWGRTCRVVSLPWSSVSCSFYCFKPPGLRGDRALPTL